MSVVDLGGPTVEGVDRATLHYWWTIDVLVGAGLGLSAAATAAAAGEPLLAVAALVATAVVVALAAWYLAAAWRHWGLVISDDRIEVRRGILTRSVAVTPFERVQYVDISSNVLERRFGISTLLLRTAATTTIGVPALGTLRAERIREAVLARIGPGDGT